MVKDSSRRPARATSGTSAAAVSEAPPRPTEGELEILRSLWQLGPSTVRRITDRLSEQRSTGYTTVLKMLQIMLGKGLVERDESQRTHVYAAAVPPETTRRHMVVDLVERAFGGSTSRLVMSALSARPADREELNEIRRLLDTLQESQR